MHAATYPPHATAPYLQYGGLAWGYGSPAAPVNIPARQTSSQDRALSSVRSASAPIFRGVPISLQEGGNLYGSPGRTAQQDPIYAGEADSSSSSDEEQTKAEKHKAAELEVEELKKQVSALEADKERLQRALEEATRSVKRSKRFALESKAIAVAVTSDDWDAPVQLTSADLQALPLQRMADLWRGLVRNMALCIPDAERRPEGRQADRLKALSGEACALMWALWDLNPTVVAAFNACDLESPSQLRRHSPGMWPKILERLQLSAQQRHALAMTRRTLLANVGVLLAEREQLLAQAQGMSWAGGNACALAADLAALVEQVQANVEAVQLCTAYYTSHAYTQVLTPVQCAAFFHQCYPFGPDLLSLMAAAAADASPSDTRLMTGAAAADALAADAWLRIGGSGGKLVAADARLTPGGCETT
ncbi:hypothetical protein COCSUDRAFT_59526 [Coccomyxa subellipsoidea C-169]|uniref:Uncharacterized protein n=1 Tax=Coccomyxa subellipsoidea (strain C-169) TaxID=574566 RepID=I0YKX3_COCSC|nr:hypothetical protein COCSUDRAFT_59526 [Coccomyxa subellipsoidea C-169]EIE19042.1 hypothetical protein COCSUDRAFT_59526 [Coccomyxa subellipsoidea C-169]|eukprot:XP_005643586.1 hypothetical protein COCSUDRAFT_59526 [Coccomyxa subellipsoidea C-169]